MLLKAKKLQMQIDTSETEVGDGADVDGEAGGEDSVTQAVTRGGSPRRATTGEQSHAHVRREKKGGLGNRRITMQ